MASQSYIAPYYVLIFQITDPVYLTSLSHKVVDSYDLDFVIQRTYFILLRQHSRKRFQDFGLYDDLLQR